MYVFDFLYILFVMISLTYFIHVLTTFVLIFIFIDFFGRMSRSNDSTFDFTTKRVHEWKCLMIASTRNSFLFNSIILGSFSSEMKSKNAQASVINLKRVFFDKFFKWISSETKSEKTLNDSSTRCFSLFNRGNRGFDVFFEFFDNPFLDDEALIFIFEKKSNEDVKLYVLEAISRSAATVIRCAESAKELIKQFVTNWGGVNCEFFMTSSGNAEAFFWNDSKFTMMKKFLNTFLFLLAWKSCDDVEFSRFDESENESSAKRPKSNHSNEKLCLTSFCGGVFLRFSIASSFDLFWIMAPSVEQTVKGSGIIVDENMQIDLKISK